MTLFDSTTPLPWPHARKMYFSHLCFRCCYLLSGSEDCSIKVWEVETGSLLHTLVPNMEAESGPIRSVAASPNGKVVTSCGGK